MRGRKKKWIFIIGSLDKECYFIASGISADEQLKNLQGNYDYPLEVVANIHTGDPRPVLEELHHLLEKKCELEKWYTLSHLELIETIGFLISKAKTHDHHYVQTHLKVDELLKSRSLLLDDQLGGVVSEAKRLEKIWRRIEITGFFNISLGLILITVHAIFHFGPQISAFCLGLGTGMTALGFMSVFISVGEISKINLKETEKIQDFLFESLGKVRKKEIVSV